MAGVRANKSAGLRDMLNKTLFVILMLMIASLQARAGNPEIVPKPKEIKFLGGAVALDAAAIVIGDKASEPEKYAAETLRKTVKKRFGVDWPVIRESADTKSCKALIVLGQRDTNRLLDQLCRAWKVDLSANSPGHDGYVIKMGTAQGRNVIVVGGSEPRGVVYGQDTLAQLISRQGGKLIAARASVRDWPSIPWRGRPATFVGQYTRPGLMDVLAQARINFIDIRDADSVYGTPPGRKLDKELIKNVIHEAHRRGFFVYGTVNCAVYPKEHDAAIGTFQEMIDLGVDGLWISVDDPGGDDRVGTQYDLIKRVIDLGRKHGMTGRKIAICPGKESYKAIVTETNRKTAKLPGMADALYFFTVVPSEQALRDARSVGIRSRPCWWHNWPRPRGGFTHAGNVSQRASGKPSYTEPMPMSEGWHNPTWDQLADAGKYCDAVMPWGGSGWGMEMVAPVIGWWGWSPESLDWNAVRARLYRTIYGPDQVQAAFAFDDRLAEIKSLFVMAPDESGMKTQQSSWPPILRNQADRQKVKDLLTEMDAYLKQLEANAPGKTELDASYLQEYYLEPARAQIDAARLIVDLPRPEYWWAAHEARVLTAVKSGALEQAGIWRKEAEARVEAETKRVRDVLSPVLKGIDGYAEEWRERFRPAATARRVSAPPALDGDLSDPAWQQAEPLTDFRQSNTGERPTDQTEVRLLYTDDALYVAFTCHESTPEKQIIKLTERDSAVWTDDSVEVFINTDGLGYPYYHLISNAAGVQYDALCTPDRPMDASWNGEWQVRTKRGSDRWTAELRIPFATLGVNEPPAGRVWLCNFARNDHAARIREEFGDKWWDISSWGYGPGGGLHVPAKFRPVVFAVD